MRKTLRERIEKATVGTKTCGHGHSSKNVLNIDNLS